MSKKGVLIPFDLLDELTDYFQQRADVEDGSDGPRPNREMLLQERLESEVTRPEGGDTFVWTIEAEEHDSFVTAIADSVEAAVERVKKPYVAPYIVSWDEPIREDDDEWSLTGHFTGVPGYCGTGPSRWVFRRFKVNRSTPQHDYPLTKEK